MQIYIFQTNTSTVVRKINLFYKFLLTICLLVFLWSALVVLIFSTPKNRTSLKQYLPEDIDMVISVNMHKLITTLFIDATYKTDFNSKDFKLFKNKDITNENPFQGVDFNSEAVLFYDTWEEHFAKGLLFNLSNEKLFNKVDQQKKNIVRFANKDRGVLIYLNDDASQRTIDHYASFAKKIISKQSTPSTPPPSNGIINLTFRGNKFSYIQDLALTIQLKDEHLLIKGTGKLDSILPIRKTHMIEEPTDRKYFEVQSGKLPDSAFHRINELTKNLDFKLPEISSQQLLIYGISIVKANGTTLVLPKLDCILRFDTTVQMDTILQNINRSSTNINLIDNHLEIGNIKYHFKQLAKNEIYFGVSKSPVIRNVKKRIVPLTKGFPSAVLDIEGDGIIAKIINLMPQIKNTKLFLKNVEYYDIHSEFVDNHHLDIVGEVRLKKGEMMSIGLAEFIAKFIN